MADSPFPSRKPSATVAGGSASQLDAPPPSPAMGQVQPGTGPSSMPSFGEMAQPFTAGTPGRATSPEILMGIMQSAETIYSMLDSMASIVPDLANDFALQKDLLERTLAKLLIQGGSGSSATSTGFNFPGGGFEGGAR